MSLWALHSIRRGHYRDDAAVPIAKALSPMNIKSSGGSAPSLLPCHGNMVACRVNFYVASCWMPRNRKTTFKAPVSERPRLY